MGDEISVRIGKGKKWTKLLLYMQNTPHEAFIIKFDDNEQARCALMRLKRSLMYHPSWYNLIISQRGCDIYIIKPDKAQKVVILDG